MTSVDEEVEEQKGKEVEEEEGRKGYDLLNSR